MSSIVNDLFSNNLVNDAPLFLPRSIQYEVIMGSFAYGVSDEKSDVDIVGYCIPPKEIVFPYIYGGQIADFDEDISNRFKHWKKNHIVYNNKKHDVTIYSIVKYLKFCMDSNPNLIDTLFAPQDCILYLSYIGKKIIEKRKLFLSKQSYNKYKGYAYRQLHKMKTKKSKEGSKRYESVKKYGYDLKFAYNLIRLLNEVEQILVEYDLDLRRNSDQLISIRNGEWSINDIISYFKSREKELDKAYRNSKIPKSVNKYAIKELLIDCLKSYLYINLF